MLPVLDELRSSVIHNDLNGHNILVKPDNISIAGIIDFGDVVFGKTVFELSIAIAYAMLEYCDESPALAGKSIIEGM